MKRSKGNLLILDFVRDITVFPAGHQARRTGWLVLKRPKLPRSFQARVLKGNKKR